MTDAWEAIEAKIRKYGDQRVDIMIRRSNLDIQDRELEIAIHTLRELQQELSPTAHPVTEEPRKRGRPKKHTNVIVVPVPHPLRSYVIKALQMLEVEKCIEPLGYAIDEVYSRVCALGFERRDGSTETDSKRNLVMQAAKYRPYVILQDGKLILTDQGRTLDTGL